MLVGGGLGVEQIATVLYPMVLFASVMLVFGVLVAKN